MRCIYCYNYGVDLVKVGDMCCSSDVTIKLCKLDCEWCCIVGDSELATVTVQNNLLWYGVIVYYNLISG